ncbi:hypothetical protein ABZ235_31435 [Streptomyces canus]|uniref:hypothetical protein n=1 Tax=Streptomyces canus TaxID=58343 RepID=UPI0033AEAC90
MGDVEAMNLVLSGSADVGQDELQDMVVNLRSRLLDLDVDDVRLDRSSDTPEGAKPTEAITVGALIITLAPPLIQGALHVVGAWMQSRPVRSVSVTLNGLTLELGQASRDEQERLIEAFIAATRDS